MKRNTFGVFEIVLPSKNGEAAIPHNSKIKVGNSAPTTDISGC